MKSFLTLSIATFALCFTVLPANAGEISVDVRFSTNEAAIIREYFLHNAAEPGKGKRNHKSLPPGIAKNLARGKSLPPGIAKQVLPGGLVAQLPPAPKGFERVVVGGKVLLVEIATQVIHDVLSDLILE